MFSPKIRNRMQSNVLIHLEQFVNEQLFRIRDEEMVMVVK